MNIAETWNFLFITGSNILLYTGEMNQTQTFLRVRALYLNFAIIVSFSFGNNGGVRITSFKFYFTNNSQPAEW